MKIWLGVIFILLFSLYLAVQIISNIWLSRLSNIVATDEEILGKYDINQNQTNISIYERNVSTEHGSMREQVHNFALAYLAFGAIQAILVLGAATIYAFMVVKASQSIHEEMLCMILGILTYIEPCVLSIKLRLNNYSILKGI